MATPNLAGTLRRSLLIKVISKPAPSREDVSSVIELTASKVVEALQAQKVAHRSYGTQWPRRRALSPCSPQDHQIKVDRPMMWRRGTAPQTRLSWLWSRLSPITKTCSDGTVKGWE